MSDYISRKAAVDAFFPVDPENDGSDGTTPVYLEQNYSNNEIESILWEVPAADVEPVRHGRWVYKPSTTTTLSTTNCSVCGWWTQDFAVVGTYCFCPSCGSKMDLEGSDA